MFHASARGRLRLKPKPLLSIYLIPQRSPEHRASFRSRSGGGGCPCNLHTCCLHKLLSLRELLLLLEIRVGSGQGRGEGLPIRKAGGSGRQREGWKERNLQLSHRPSHRPPESSLSHPELAVGGVTCSVGAPDPPGLRGGWGKQAPAVFCSFCAPSGVTYGCTIRDPSLSLWILLKHFFPGWGFDLVV